MNEMTQTDTNPDDLRLTLQRHIKAPVEAVYKAWLDPATLTRFMSNCEGMSLATAETDPRVGGRFLLGMNTGTRVIDHRGTYLELVPHSRIAFTWESEFCTLEGSRVTLDLVPEGEGTLLTLTHVRFANESSRDGHSGGWTTILDGLVATSL
jgi:uncharacterized protein YndB with AHSA1/START domain